MKGLFIPEITTEMFRNGCLESIESLMAEGEIYDIDYPLEPCDIRGNTNEIITESEKLKLNEALQIMIRITERMEREGKKKLVYESQKDKIRVEYNTRMIKFFTQAVYEISKGVAE